LAPLVVDVEAKGAHGPSRLRPTAVSSIVVVDRRTGMKKHASELEADRIELVVS